MADPVCPCCGAALVPLWVCIAGCGWAAGRAADRNDPGDLAMAGRLLREQNQREREGQT